MICIRRSPWDRKEQGEMPCSMKGSNTRITNASTQVSVLYSSLASWQVWLSSKALTSMVARARSWARCASYTSRSRFIIPKITIALCSWFCDVFCASRTLHHHTLTLLSLPPSSTSDPSLGYQHPLLVRTENPNNKTPPTNATPQMLALNGLLTSPSPLR